MYVFPKERGYRPISDYALIGDCHSAALVALDGSIDFCCLPNFNSGAIFCRLLDKGKGGYFRLSAGDEKAFTRRYVSQSNIIETTFRTGGGEIVVTDLMPVRKVPVDSQGRDIAASHRIVRRATCTEGKGTVLLELKPTPGFASDKAKMTVRPGAGALVESRNGYFALSWGADIARDEETLVGYTTLSKGEQIDCVFTYCDSLSQADSALSAHYDADNEVWQTLEYWKEWAQSCTYTGAYPDAVMRSALALKLMTFEPTGAIIASPTTSLPEVLGGERNWDYRYAWLRDSSFTLLALLRLGYVGEARDFVAFIRRICSVHSRRKSPFQIVYGIDGETRLSEVSLDHLDGYCGSRPVRVGNAAYKQVQLDVYGEVLDCIHLFHLRGGFEHDGRSEMTKELMDIVSDTVNWVAHHWREADSGIWEMRSGRRQFVYSKLMCWVALDRGIKLGEVFRIESDLAAWKKTRQQIRASILAEGFNAQIGAYTQYYGSSDLDASALEIPLVGFLPVSDPRMTKTIELIKTRLAKNGMIFRYLSDDGLAGSEAAFSMVTFWLISCLALMARKDEARERFEYLLSMANDVGLYAEELDSATHAQLGNFPQALTHIGLINAASELSEPGNG